MQHGALDELAQTGNAAVAQVSPWAGPREPARDQEPHVAATEDHQELLGHGLEGQERCQSRASLQAEQGTRPTPFSPCSDRSRTVASGTDNWPRPLVASSAGTLSPQGVTPLARGWPWAPARSVPASSGLFVTVDSQRASTCRDVTCPEFT